MGTRSYRPIAEAAVDVVVRGGRINVSGNAKYNKQDWKDKTCHGYGRKGHPKWACQKQSSGEKYEVKDDDDKSS